MTNGIKILIAFAIALLGFAGICGGLYLRPIGIVDEKVQLCAFYMIMHGLITLVVCVAYIFIKAWEKYEPFIQKESLDNLEEVSVESVN